MFSLALALQLRHISLHGFYVVFWAAHCTNGTAVNCRMDEITTSPFITIKQNYRQSGLWYILRLHTPRRLATYRSLFRWTSPTYFLSLALGLYCFPQPLDPVPPWECPAQDSLIAAHRTGHHRTRRWPGDFRAYCSMSCSLND